jgi:protein-S-isoprenylcysteine O-methyltransferase Ste14
LFYSLYLIYFGMICLRKFGKIANDRAENTLYDFERTTLLVDQGIYKYIRHPLYASLLFLTWGIFFKNMTMVLFLVSLLSSVFLFVTAIFDEKECVAFFGDPYREYINKSKRFIPFVL